MKPLFVKVDSPTMAVQSKFLIAFCVVAGMASATFADDEVTRLSAKRGVRGKIEKQDSSKIVVKTRAGQSVTIPVDDVVRVRYDKEPTSLNLSRTSELNGSLQRALEGFTKAKEQAGTKNKDLAVEINFLIARTNARLAGASAEKMSEAVKQLTDFTAANKNSIRYYEALNLLSTLHLQNGDIANARTAVADLKSAPVKSLKMTAQIIEGRALLAENKPGEAAKAFQAAASMAGNDPVEKAKGLEGLLGTAMCQQKQQQFDQAIKTLDQVLEKTVVTDTAVQAEAYLRRGDVFRSQQKTKDAIFEYLHVDLLFSAHKSLHAEALYNLATLWTTSGHPDRAAEAKAALMSDYAGSGWAKKLAGG